MNVQMNELASLAYNELIGPQKKINRSFSYGAPPIRCSESFLKCANGYGVSVPRIVSGSELFTRVINDPLYQVNERETALLKQPKLKSFLDDVRSVAEFGPGDGVKTAVLLSQIATLSAYMGIEWSKDNIVAAEQALQAVPIRFLLEENFLEQGWIPRAQEFFSKPGEVMFCIFGNTMANYEPERAQKLLLDCFNNFSNQTNTKVLMGFDCRTDNMDLQRSYGNPITAVFFLNALRYLNKVLSADFDPNNFDYEVDVTRETYGKNVNMYLTSKIDQCFDVVVNGIKKDIGFRKGERVFVGDSRKFSQDVVLDIAAKAELKISAKTGVLDDRGICLFPFVSRCGGPR